VPRGLSELQTEFATALTRPDGARVPPDVFAGPEDRTADLLGIYRGNSKANWSKALEGAYPVIRLLVGDEFFSGLVREYARAEPSSEGDLNRFGDRFADFLAGFPHARTLPYLPDVARLEWAVHRAFYAADAPRLDLAEVALLRDDQLATGRLRLAPACALVRSAYPVARIWEVHQPEYAAEMAVDLDGGGETAFVHRPAFRVAVDALRPADAAFLGMCEKGCPLTAALDAALSVDPDFALQALLVEWVRRGAIVGIEATQERAP
jgi:hypothetical protein